LRPLLFFAALLSAGFSQAQDVVLFHETFELDDNGSYTFDSATPFASGNNGKAYWGIWNEAGATGDFGDDAGPLPSQVAFYSGYDGAVLVGRNMSHVSVLAEPGFNLKQNISVEAAPLNLTVAVKLAANDGGNEGYEDDDYFRVYARVSGSEIWGDPLIELVGSELDTLSNSFSQFSASIEASADSVDVKLEMSCDQGKERLAAEDFMVLGCGDIDSDGLCDESDNCVDVYACNYEDAGAVECLYEDVVGDCGGACLMMTQEKEGVEPLFFGLRRF
jgi:hypothetical protein